MSSLISSRLHKWQHGELVTLWEEARVESKETVGFFRSASLQKNNNLRALKLARDGRYDDATRALLSKGCVSNEDKDALNDLLRHHPQSSLPMSSETVPSALTVHSSAIIAALRDLPRGSRAGFSKLRVQHSLDATVGVTALSSHACLENLTKLTHLLLSGKLDKCISPWLVSAPLTTLQKKSGGFRPIYSSW